MAKVVFTAKLPLRIKKLAKYWVSSCPILDVFSQGETEEAAKKNLEIALRLFFISCFERGTLDDVLRDCGFSLVTEIDEPIEDDDDSFIEVPIDLIAKENRCSAECRE